MKNTVSTPIICAAIALLAFSVQSAEAQSGPANLFLEAKEHEILLEKPASMPANTLRQRPVKINPEALRANQITLTLFDGQTVTFQRAQGESARVFEGGWSGIALGTEMGSLSITPTSAGLHATVFLGRKFFRVAPMGKNQHWLLDIDRSQLPDEDCRHLKTSSALLQKICNSPDASGDDPIECNIRLLVAYTDAANTWSVANGFGDALGLAQAAIDATNQTYINSGVVFRVELAHLVRVGYTESGSFATDVDRFQATADGNMDEVHGLRDLYRADLCVLITDGNSACGRAFEIGANADEAFCAANAGCCVDNFSFAHELGHLYGARHDLFVDTDDTPFDFGHGFVDIDEGWRTVMSYNDACEDAGTSCTRLGFWSSPDLDHPSSGTAMGTAADNHNARVLNETGDDLRAFRMQSANHLLSNTTLSGVTFADLTAVNSIQAGNNYVVQATADVRFRAGQSVRLTPGFSARPNAAFRASIQPINPCAGERPATERVSEAGSLQDLRLSPNPVSDRLRVQYLLMEEGPVSMLIVNALGEVVATPMPAQQQETGNYTVDVSVVDLPRGLYWCLVFYPDGSRAHQAFVVNDER